MADAKDKPKDAIDEGVAHAKKITDAVAEKVSEVAGGVRDMAEQTDAQVRAHYAEVAGRAREGFRQAGGMVRENPGRSVAVAFGIGLSLGLVVGLALRPQRA